jgi:heterodisulfide reductase subunit C2
MLRLKGNPEERNFLREVIQRSGQNLLECLQCGKCSGSCPITSDTVPGPRRLIALILSGMKQQSLLDPTWWYCVSCGSCASRCPVEINMYQVATTLCEIAEETGIKSSEPAIHLFEEVFLKSIRKNGRVQELKAVMEFNLRRFTPFKDAVKGAKLIAKGAIKPKDMVTRAKSDPEILRIFERVEQMRHGE